MYNLVGSFKSGRLLPSHGLEKAARRESRPPEGIKGATSSMTISIHIPAVLRSYCQGASQLSLSVPSVRAALEQIERTHPLLYKSICDETGAIRRHVNVFVNTSDVREREGLDTALAPGDVLTILPAVSGGQKTVNLEFSA